MLEPLLDGIVLGLIPVTILGLMVSAYLQFRRSNQLFEEMRDRSEQQEE
jgi:cytochrome b6-f complex subunit 5